MGQRLSYHKALRFQLYCSWRKSKIEIFFGALKKHSKPISNVPQIKSTLQESAVRNGVLNFDSYLSYLKSQMRQSVVCNKNYRKRFDQDSIILHLLNFANWHKTIFMHSLIHPRQISQLRITLLIILLQLQATVYSQPAQLDNTFTTGFGANAGINDLIIQPDDKVIIAGMFVSFNGTPAGRIIRLLPDGAIDSTWITSTGGADFDIRGMALQPDRKVLVGGIFDLYHGAVANQLVRLDSIGNIDPTFVVGIGPNNEVQGITVNNNRAVIHGFFNEYQGIQVPGFAVLQMNGALDTSFQLPTELFISISDFKILPNDQLYIGGNFTTYNGQTVNRIVRLHPNGSIDTTFNTGTGVNAMVRRLLVQNNGDILVAGTFNTYNGAAVSRLIRLHPNGDRDSTFNAAVPSLATLDALAIDTAGRIYITGSNAGTLFLKRLLSDGTEDTSFNTSIGFNGNITQLALQSNDKLMVAGYFTMYQNQQAGRVARIFTNNLTASTEDIINDGNVTLYPNPTSDEFYLRIHNAWPEEIYLKVRDIHGRQIYEGKYNANEHLRITTAGWWPGIYLVEVVNTKGDNFVRRLLKL